MTLPSRKQMFAAVLLGMALLVIACGPEKVLYVDKAWVQLSPNPDTPSAGYFTVHAGKDDVQLLSVISPVVLRVEMHESAEKNGMMSMQPVDSVDIPAKERVEFAPGGKHLMIWGINAATQKEAKLPLTFIFSNGDRIIYDAVIRKVGEGPAPAKGDDGMGNMAH